MFKVGQNVSGKIRLIINNIFRGQSDKTDTIETLRHKEGYNNCKL